MKKRKVYPGEVHHVCQQTIGGVLVFYCTADYLVFFTIYCTVARRMALSSGRTVTYITLSDWRMIRCSCGVKALCPAGNRQPGIPAAIIRQIRAETSVVAVFLGELSIRFSV